MMQSMKHWYLLLIVGILFVVFGIWMFFYPVDSYLGLALLFGCSFLFSGIFESVFAVVNRKEMQNWGWSLVLGLFTLLFGIFLISNFGLTMVILPLYVGFVFLFRSLGAIGFSFDLKHYNVSGWGWLMALGILGVVFSCILIVNPVFAGMTLVVWTALGFIASGVFNIMLSLKVRRLHSFLKPIEK